METLIKAIDKAVRTGGVFTLDEVAVVLQEIQVVAQKVKAYDDMQEAKKEPVKKPAKNTNKEEK